MHNKHAPEKSTLLRAEMKNYINNVLAISPFSNVPDSFKDTAITHNFEVVADGIWSSYDEGKLCTGLDMTPQMSTDLFSPRP